MDIPGDFRLGASSAAYQIEGGWDADGKGESIWDRFCHAPGRIRGGDTGDVACDHYGRYEEDLDLLQGAGLDAYRFSVAWTRVLPEGVGAVNEAGLGFYDRLVDALLARGVEPWACLYHWDLPQALQERGGWTNRDVAGWFADYAGVVARRLGDRVKRWVPLNEPNTHAVLGHARGTHAPALRGSGAAPAAFHHANLAHVEAARGLRAEVADARVGAVVLLNEWVPASPAPEDTDAADAAETFWNRGALDPLLTGRYSDAVLALDPVFAGDAEVLATAPASLDWLGVNYYGPYRIAAAPDGGRRWVSDPAAPKTAMGWEIDPDGLRRRLVALAGAGLTVPIYVTENGAAFDDAAGPDGRVRDDARIAYLRDHLGAALAARAEGADVRGYFAWSLTDNFEWAEGYAYRFGLVHVDYATQARTPKASYDWLTRVARGRRLVLPPKPARGAARE